MQRVLCRDQASRFTLNVLKEYKPTCCYDKDILSRPGISNRDRWILHQLQTSVDIVNKAMGSYTFADSCQALYDFWLKLFCNNYLEMAKPLLYGPCAASRRAARHAPRGSERRGTPEETSRKTSVDPVPTSIVI